MPSEAFQKALSKQRNAAKLMEAAKNATAGNSCPKIPDGTYLVRVRATCGVTTNKMTPFVELRWAIAEGEHQGKGWRKTHFLGETDDPERDLKNAASFGSDMKVLLELDDINFDSLQAINAAVDEIDAKSPLVRAALRTKESKGKTFINIFFNSVEKVGQVTPADGLAEVLKDMDVMYQGKKSRVLSSNPLTKTCCLQNEGGEKVPGIAWNDVAPVA